jgi:hypothetical protein
VSSPSACFKPVERSIRKTRLPRFALSQSTAKTPHVVCTGLESSSIIWEGGPECCSTTVISGTKAAVMGTLYGVTTSYSFLGLCRRYPSLHFCMPKWPSTNVRARSTKTVTCAVSFNQPLQATNMGALPTSSFPVLFRIALIEAQLLHAILLPF